MGVKSNYFRHSFTAHQDIKIRKLIDRIGPKGYAVYFMLLEIYCMKLRDDDTGQIEQEIDLKLLASLLKVRSDFVRSCIEVLSELNLLIKLCSNSNSTMIKVSIPNSLKYFGSYQKVRDENIPNKRKEKEIKEKEIIIKKLTPDEIIDLWNFKHGAKFGRCPGVGGGKHRDNILEAIQFLPTLESWDELFTKATSSDFLSGNNSSDWTVNFLWLIDYDNALKVLSDNYDDQKIVRAIQAEFLQKVSK
jgi:hypothetical protein